MNRHFCAKTPALARTLPLLLILIGFGASSTAQTIYVVDSFDPGGVGGNRYAGGQINNVWTNWFGGAFSNVVWESPG